MPCWQMEKITGTICNIPEDNIDVTNLLPKNADRHVRVSEWTILYSCLNVKELLARGRCEIWSLSDCNWTRSHNHLVYKRTLNHLAKLPIMIIFHCATSCCCCQYLYNKPGSFSCFIRSWKGKMYCNILCNTSSIHHSFEDTCNLNN